MYILTTMSFVESVRIRFGLDGLISAFSIGLSLTTNGLLGDEVGGCLFGLGGSFGRILFSCESEDSVGTVFITVVVTLCFALPYNIWRKKFNWQGIKSRI